MKKLLLTILLVLGMGFVFNPFVAKAAETPSVTYILTIEDAPDDEIILEEEVDDFLAELNQTVAAVFAYLGGIAGLGALLAFVLRFIKDRAVFSRLRNLIEDLTKKAEDETEALSAMSKLLDASNKRSEKLEKTVVNLVNLSDADPEIKKAALQELKTNELIEVGLKQIESKKQKAQAVQEQLDRETESLLNKLAKKDL